MIIYKTTNLINGKFYVGKDANNRNYYLGSGSILDRAIKKYGRENFKKEILEECNSLEELSEKEIFWIKELNATDETIGYNIAEGGLGGDTFTNDPNKEIRREIIRENSIGRKHSEETKKKLSNLKKGIKFSEEHKQKLKELHKGMLGKSQSEETKVKIGLANKNKLKIKCPYCNMVSSNKTNMLRWHFDNCKFKNNNNDN